MRNIVAEILGKAKSLLTRNKDLYGLIELQAKLNKLKSYRHPKLVKESQEAIDHLMRELQLVSDAIKLEPNQGFLHFVYGFKQKEVFPYYAYLAIVTAQAHNPNWPVLFCYAHEPTGPWWDKIKPKIHTIQMEDFSYFMGARFYHYAHKADVVRLLMLRELGGIYLDMDTITVKPLGHLLEHDFGMAVQSAVHQAAAGLCNAIMWGKPYSDFCVLWVNTYGAFRSKGRDDYWDFHSVKLPGMLARDHAKSITILGHRAFFYPLWTDIERFLFSESGDKFLPHLESALGFHLWNGATEDMLQAVTPEWIEKSGSAYANYVRVALGIKAPKGPIQLPSSRSDYIGVTALKRLPPKINPPVKPNGSAKLSADIAKEDKGEKKSADGQASELTGASAGLPILSGNSISNSNVTSENS
jgi:hypothetical protein